MIEASKPAASPTSASPTAPARRGLRQDRRPASALAAEPLAPECTIDDFTKVDLRVARVIAAEDVAEAQEAAEAHAEPRRRQRRAPSSPASRRPTSRKTSSAGW